MSLGSRGAGQLAPSLASNSLIEPYSASILLGADVGHQRAESLVGQRRLFPAEVSPRCRPRGLPLDGMGTFL